jgi:hypothetical protein
MMTSLTVAELEEEALAIDAARNFRELRAL